MKENSNRTDAHFPKTHWSDIIKAREHGNLEAKEALQRLCQAYRNPVYAFIRRWPKNPEEAEDLTQEFFKQRILGENYLNKIKVEGGKFRNYVKKSLKHFVLDEQKRRHLNVISLDCLSEENGIEIEAEETVSPEDLFDVHWAQTLLEQALTKLRDKYVAKGNGNLFDELQSCLTGAGDQLLYAEVGARLGMSENAVKQQVFNMRKAWQKFRKAEVRATVSSEEEMESEFEDLKALITRYPRFIQIRAPSKTSNQPINF